MVGVKYFLPINHFLLNHEQPTYEFRHSALVIGGVVKYFLHTALVIGVGVKYFLPIKYFLHAALVIGGVVNYFLHTALLLG